MSDERPPDDGATDADGYDRDHDGDDVRAATDRERTTDAVDRRDSDATATAARGEAQTGESAPEGRDRAAAETATGTGGNGDGDGAHDDGGASGGRSDRIAFWVSALFGLALAVGAVALVSGSAPLFEDILRIRPTVEGGGIGADWVVGNTGPILEAAIAIVHLADVVMGIFILLMVFIHWAAFRRLATRMRPPAGSARARESAAATDGGVPDASPDGDSGRSDQSGSSRSSSGPADDTAPTDGGDRR